MSVITAYLLGLATLPAAAATVWLLYRLFRREAWLCPYCLAWTAHTKEKPDTALYLPAILTWASVLVHGRPFSFMGGRHAIAHGGGSTRSTTSGRRIRPGASNRNV